ncbi:MAG: hypothetical protein DHS20C01_35200 [marine bacterium B5-7]|nr:MAG: hypothetical protein DHS20C01_35200 [marine bacterium B5-7]
MQEKIINNSNTDKVYISEGCYITELSNSEDDPDLSIALARVPPGITTHWHRLINTAERYLIQSGTGIVEVGDLPPCNVHPGDIVLVPTMCRQRITNTGPDDLIFLAICTPRFMNSSYQEIPE